MCVVYHNCISSFNDRSRQVLGRMGGDWVEYVNGCIRVLTHATSGVSTGSTGGKLLFDTFVEGRTAALRSDSLLNLGTFAGHVSLLIQNVCPRLPWMLDW